MDDWLGSDGEQSISILVKFEMEENGKILSDSAKKARTHEPKNGCKHHWLEVTMKTGGET